MSFTLSILRCISKWRQCPRNYLHLHIGNPKWINQNLLKLVIRICFCNRPANQVMPITTTTQWSLMTITSLNITDYILIMLSFMPVTARPAPQSIIEMAPITSNHIPQSTQQTHQTSLWQPWRAEKRPNPTAQKRQHNKVWGWP